MTKRSTHDEIGKAVVVEVAAATDGKSCEICRGTPLENESRSRRQVGEIDCPEPTGPAEDDISGACFHSPAIIRDCAYDQIVEAIMIDVPGAGHAEPRAIVDGSPLDEETGGAEVAEVDGAETVGLAEDHIGRTPSGTGARAANDQVVKAIMVDVARAGDAGAHPIINCGAEDGETVAGAKVEEADGVGIVGLAEHDIGGARSIMPIAGTDDDVVEAVSIDIAGVRHTDAERAIISRSECADDLDPRRRGESGKADGAGRGRAAEDHIGLGNVAIPERPAA